MNKCFDYIETVQLKFTLYSCPGFDLNDSPKIMRNKKVLPIRAALSY